MIRTSINCGASCSRADQMESISFCIQYLSSCFGCFCFVLFCIFGFLLQWDTLSESKCLERKHVLWISNMSCLNWLLHPSRWKSWVWAAGKLCVPQLLVPVSRLQQVLQLRGTVNGVCRTVMGKGRHCSWHHCYVWPLKGRDRPENKIHFISWWCPMCGKGQGPGHTLWQNICETVRSEQRPLYRGSHGGIFP